MKRRLFLAVNLPEGVQASVSSGVAVLEKDFSGKQARFLDDKNRHITLIFLGYQADEALSGILAAMESAVEKFSGPKIELDSNFSYVPEKNPRMIWLKCSKDTSTTLGKVKDFLEEKLIDNKIHFKIENRVFNAHMTICRFADLMRNNLPKLSVNLKVNLSFGAASLDLMESHLSRSGAEYELLQSMDWSKI